MKADVQYEHEKVQELRTLSLWSDGHVWVSPEQHGNLVSLILIIWAHSLPFRFRLHRLVINLACFSIPIRTCYSLPLKLKGHGQANIPPMKDGCFLKSNRLDISCNREHSPDSGSHSRHRASFWWLSILQRGKFHPNPRPLDVHVHDSQSMLHRQSVRAISRRGRVE